MKVILTQLESLHASWRFVGKLVLYTFVKRVWLVKMIQFTDRLNHQLMLQYLTLGNIT
jgi:hypothetical protein